MYPSKVEICGDVLARRLKNRPDRDSLIDRHIIPAHSAAPGIHDKVTLLERKKTGDFLQKKIRTRPSRQQLIQRHILTDARVDPSLLENMGRLERQRITDSLNERLQARPGPIELINEGILPVDSPLQNVLIEDEDGSKAGYSKSLSPQSSLVGSPKVAELESGITTLNCTSPSPPLHDSFSETYKSQFHNVSNDNMNPNCLVRKASVDSNISYYSGQTPISLSQKENEKLVRTINKKPKPQKTKVKKLKFHECRPPEMLNQEPTGTSEVDERYKKLLEQQTLYLRLQVLWQNAMVNALQGNTESVEAVTEEMESAIKKEVTSDPQLIQSIKGKKLDDLRVIDLRAQLKQRGLLVSGTKAKLIERLSAFEQGRTTPADFGYSTGNSLNENMTHMSSIPSITKDEIAPVSTVVQVTTYSTNSGQAYQVIQAVSQPSRNVYQVLPAHCIPATQQIPQIQLNHVNIHPVVEVTEPHVMTIEDAASDVNQTTSGMKQQKTSVQLSHMTQQADHNTPTILIHSGPQLQKASLLQHEKPKVQQYSDFSQPSYQMSPLGKIESSCQSTSQYNQSKYIISPTKNDICQQLSGVKNNDEDEKKLGIGNQNSNNNFRSRSSSEPQNCLKRNKDISIENFKSGSPNDNFRTSGNQSTLSPPGYKPTQHRGSESRRDTYDDIMDIIGELSTPSPSNAGSPLMTTSSSPNFHMVSSNKVENPPPYNACAYTNPKSRNTDNKCLNVSPQHKLFSSVPENMNTLGSNATNSNNFLSSPYGSLSPNSLNGSLGSNLSGSLSSLQANTHSNSYNNLNHSSSIGNLPNHFSSDSNINHSSSTGNIPQQIQSDNYHRLSSSPNMSGTSPYGTSPTTSSNYLKNEYRAVSPMDLHPDDSMAMDIDNFSSNNNQNNLGWLDLNMETNSPNNLQYQSIPPKEMHRGNTYYSTQNSNSNMGDINPSMVHANALYGNNTRTQNTIYGNSRIQDGCISLFDLEGAEY